LLDQRPPLEAQLIDLADEIAYDNADLDDGYEAHLLTLEQICAGIPVFDRFFREAEQLYPNVAEKLKFNEAVKGILDRMVGDLIRNLQEQIKIEGIRSLEDVRACPRRLATFSSEVEEERRGAKEFLYRNLYFSAALDPEKNDAERVIRELFEFWMARPESLPPTYQEKAGLEPLPRVVCDYIAGMTDNFIYEQHEKYCGTN
jgi:dGTPase